MHDHQTTELSDAEKIDIVRSAWCRYVKELLAAEDLADESVLIVNHKSTPKQNCIGKRYLMAVILTGAYSRFLDILADLYGSSELLKIVKWNGNRELTLFGLLKLTEKTKRPRNETVWTRYRNSARYKRILTSALEGKDWSSNNQDNSPLLGG